MSLDSEIVCFGDVMLESILRVPSLPCPNATLVVDGKPKELGGTAYNLAWYFAQWGWRCKLVGVTGSADESLVSATLRGAALSTDSLISTAGDSDHLLVLVDTESRLWAVYLRARLPADVESRILHLCLPARILVLTGSRHPRLRAASLDVALKFDGNLLAFSPSYALYEYSADEILTLSRAAQVIILNENELAFTLLRTGCSDATQFAAKLGGILLVTNADQGAVLYQRGIVRSFPSYSNRKGDVIGAGDAFFAGFLQSLLCGDSAANAGLVASLVAARLVECSCVRAQIDLEHISGRLRTLKTGTDVSRKSGEPR